MKMTLVRLLAILAFCMTATAQNATGVAEGEPKINSTQSRPASLIPGQDAHLDNAGRVAATYCDCDSRVHMAAPECECLRRWYKGSNGIPKGEKAPVMLNGPILEGKPLPEGTRWATIQTEAAKKANNMPNPPRVVI